MPTCSDDDKGKKWSSRSYRRKTETEFVGHLNETKCDARSYMP